MRNQITGLAVIVEMDGQTHLVVLTQEERDAVADFIEELHAGEILVTGPLDESAASLIGNQN